MWLRSWEREKVQEVWQCEARSLDPARPCVRLWLLGVKWVWIEAWQDPICILKAAVLKTTTGEQRQAKRPFRKLFIHPGDSYVQGSSCGMCKKRSSSLYILKVQDIVIDRMTLIFLAWQIGNIKLSLTESKIKSSVVVILSSSGFLDIQVEILRRCWSSREWRKETTLSGCRFCLKPGSGIRSSREEINRTKKKKERKGKGLTCGSWGTEMLKYQVL